MRQIEEPQWAHDAVLLRRFLQSASRFWTQGGARVWLLSALLLSLVAAQLLTQYLLNYWNREFFDALEQRDLTQLHRKAVLLLALVALSTTLAVVSVWGRMTAQRLWRQFVTRHLIKVWLRNGRYARLGTQGAMHVADNAEFRIAEDTRIATDAPIDLAMSLISSIVTVVVFIDILARVGGGITVVLGGIALTVPAYLSVGVVVYSGVVTAAMLLVGRRWTDVVQQQLQAEAAFRASANLLRESGEGFVTRQPERKLRYALWIGLHDVIERWRVLCGQHMRTTLVSNANALLAPSVGLLLCVPKYVEGAISLGEVTQAAAAFAVVQGALNWLVDNFQRMGDWRSSAIRVGALLFALDALKADESSSLEDRVTVSQA